MLLGCDSTYIAVSSISFKLATASLGAQSCLPWCHGPQFIPHKRIAVALAHYRLKARKAETVEAVPEAAHCPKAE